MLPLTFQIAKLYVSIVVEITSFSASKSHCKIIRPGDCRLVEEVGEEIRGGEKDGGRREGSRRRTEKMEEEEE